MSLKFETRIRASDRCKVTKIYNDKANFAGYDLLKLKGTLFKLDNLRVKIAESDSKIAALKFEANISEADFQEELDECEKYSDKLDLCLNMLNSQESQPITQPDRSELPRSLLKSPQAPLPVFSSEPGKTSKHSSATSKKQPVSLNILIMISSYC